MLPQLEAKGIKAFLVTIGTAERGLEFAELTSFPASKLLADPDSVTYAALNLRKGIADMFFNPQVYSLFTTIVPACSCNVVL